ncbi:MAG: hypothetical protein ACO1N5_00070 [Noviherbaspirillum sp.]
MKAKPVIPREQAKQDIEETISYYLEKEAEKAPSVSSTLSSTHMPTSVAVPVPVRHATHTN